MQPAPHQAGWQDLVAGSECCSAVPYREYGPGHTETATPAPAPAPAPAPPVGWMACPFCYTPQLTLPHTACPPPASPLFPQVWVNSASVLSTIVVASALQAAEGLSPAQAEAMVAALLKAKR